MRKEEIIRAWRDQDYLSSLSDEQRSFLPANPVGMIELSQDALFNVLGAAVATQSCSDDCNSCWTCLISCCCC